jgi:DNA-binding MarR family transcriptional regulator
VKSIVAIGLVEYATDPDDGRAKVHDLTALGRETLLKVRSTWDEVIDELLVDLGDSEHSGLAMYLPALGRSMERAIDEATPGAR